MQWSAVTMTLFAGVAILFVAGVGLIWVGLKRTPDRLPAGADDVLDAIVTGRLGPPPGPKSVDHTGEVRLVPKATAARPTPRPAVTPRPARPVTAAAAPPADTGSVTIVRDPRDVLAEQESDDDLTLSERLFFADEPQLNRF